MGKIKIVLNTSPDGFCGHEFVIADAEFHEFVHGLLSNTQTVAFGRKTFELFQEVWPKVLESDNQPGSQVKMAQALNDIDKKVFSTTLNHMKWNNSSIARKINRQEIDDFKQSSHKDMLTIGSPGIVAALTKLDLVDEYHFALQPTIAGKGTVRLFDKINLDAGQPLRFAGVKQLRSGVVIISYLKAN